MKSLKIGLTILTLSVFSFAATNSVSAINPVENDSTATQKESNDKLFKQFEKSLLFGLSSDVNGVLESTFYNAVSFKIIYPEFSSNKVLDKIRKVALEGDSHQLRYKAYLTLAYYTNQDQFSSPEDLAEIMDVKDHDKIFFYLQNEVQSGQLTFN
ncbi:MAG: hypothetical protein WEA56_08270 [Balneolaceae bacterium]